MENDDKLNDLCGAPTTEIVETSTGYGIKIKGNVNYEPLKTNRFLVKFPKGCNIQEWWVKSIDKSPILLVCDDIEEEIPSITNGLKTIHIRFKEIDKWGDIVFLNEFRKFNKLEDRTIIFEDLDNIGVVVNREFFTNCKATEIYFSGCNYEIDEIKTCTVIFEYDEILDELK